MLLLVSFKGVLVFKHRRGVGFAVVEVLLAEGDADFVSSVGHEDKAGYASGWFAADDAGLRAFLVWTLNGGRCGCGCGLLECETHGFCLVYLKKSSSRRWSLTCMKRCFLQKSKMRFSSGSLPSLNSLLKPIRPVMTRISKDPSMARIW